MDIVANSGKWLFIFYLTVSTNFLGSLFGCRVQTLFINNMYVKHILGFLILYFFVSLVDAPTLSPLRKLALTTIIYFCFIMSTKMNINIWFGFMSALGLAYVIGIFKDTYKNEACARYFVAMQTFLVSCAVIMMLIGFVHYMGEKKLKYKNEFSYCTFFIGKPQCLDETPGTGKTFMETLKIGLKPVIKKN